MQVKVTPAQVAKVESAIGVNCNGWHGDDGQHDCVLQILMDAGQDRFSGHEIQEAIRLSGDALDTAHNGAYNAYDKVVWAVAFLTA